MPNKRLLALLNIRPDEARMAALVTLFFGLIDLGGAVGDSVADALFFRRFGVEYLPYMYIAVGLLTIGATLGYAAFLGRFERGRFFTSLLGLMALLLLAERAAMMLDLRALYPVLWLSINVILPLLSTVLWTTAGEACDTRQAKRLFPLFISGSIAGSLLASLIIGPAARLLGTENLIFLYVLALVAGAVLIRRLARLYFRPLSSPNPRSTFRTDLSAGYRYVSRAPLFQLLAVCAVLFSILYFSVSFPFGKAVSANFTSEADLAGFIGLFKGLSSVLMFLAALLVANRLYARIGIVNALLILPITYLLGFVFLAATYSLPSVVFVRLVQVVVMSGASDGAFSAFFNVVPDNLRAQVRAFNGGVISQIGIILSGVLLLLSSLLNTTAIFIMGIVAAALCAYVVWQMRRRYVESLVAALGAGRLDIFAEGYRTFAGLSQDLEAVRTLVSALADPKPATQRLAADILGRIGAVAAVPALIQRLGETAGDVRLSVIRALGQLADRRAAQPVLGLLTDDTPAVRAAALEALPALCDVEPTVQGLVQPLLNDSAFPVRLQAAISLGKLGQADAARRAILGLLNNAKAETDRLRILQSFRLIVQPDAPPAEDMQTAVSQALHDPSPALRRAACEALAGARTPSALQTLANALSDAAPSVRAAAAQALRSGGPAATPYVVARLDTASDAEAVIEAFPIDDPATRAPLRDYAQATIARLQAWRQASQALPRQGSATRFLGYLLEARAAQAEQQVVRIIGLLGNPRAMQLVARTLSTGSPKVRATALEALDTLGDKPLVRALLPLLEAAPAGEKSGTSQKTAVDEIVRRLLAGDNPLMAAVAARAAAELGVTGLLSAPPVASTTAQTSPALRPAGDTMQTLPTLPLVDRLLLLKEVPLFSDLSPDDLVQVAQVAEERWFADGAVLCREGEAGDDLFVIASGQVRVTRRAEGTLHVLATRQVGEFVGEMAIIESAPRFATVSAVGETRTLAINAASFKAILEDCPEVALAVMRGLSRRLREPHP